jgi:3alpha(or 20beta)-hydroxysteroid dehydrogenase
MLFEGRVALVTGGARGQGASHARRLCEEGARVVITDVLDDLGEATAEEIRATGGDARYLHLDVRETGEWTTVVDAVKADLGSIDILVNNAGVCALSSVSECSDDEWDLVMATNGAGVLKGSRAVLPLMQAQGKGVIVNTTSAFAVRGSWGYAAYQASKAAVIGLTRSMAITYAADGIRVNAVAPSAVDTPMLDMELEHFAKNPYFDFDESLKKYPISRVARPEEVSEMVVFLASDRSSYTTGGVFPVDGGTLA